MSLAIYPGSFDPITKGHIDVLKKAAKIFDKVIIAVSINPAKKGMFSIDERIELIKESIKGIDGVEVDYFEGLTAKYAGEKGANAIIRGLRAVSDFEIPLGAMEPSLVWILLRLPQHLPCDPGDSLARWFPLWRGKIAV